MNDTKRIDFLQKLLDSNDVIKMSENTLKQSQPNMANIKFELFTCYSQHLHGNSVRELIDKCLEYEKPPDETIYFKFKDGTSAPIDKMFDATGKLKKNIHSVNDL